MQDNFHNIDIEQSILGCILLQNKYWEYCYFLKEEHFVEKVHKEIFLVIKQAFEKNISVDGIYLSNLIPLHEKYIYELMEKSYVSEKTIESHVSFLIELNLMRKILLITYKIKELLIDFKLGNGMDILNNIEKNILNLRNENSSYSDPIHISKAMDNKLKDMDLKNQNPDGLIGLSTGFNQLDKLTNGLQGGQLIILAARPSMGKTALALNVAMQAIKKDKTVLFFSMEMSMNEILTRILSSLTKMDQYKLKTGKLDKEEWLKVSNCMDFLSKKNLYLDENAILTTHDIFNKIRRTIHNNKKIDLVIIDYLQLMSGPNKNKSENRVLEVSDISRNLKIISKEFNIPLIVLSQLNRSVESRADKRPYMSDLRDSGSIEQDADMIMFIYRDEVYNPNSQYKDIAELILSKNRNGKTGTIKLKYHSDFVTFSE